MWQGRYGTARNAAQCLWARQYNIAYKVRPMAAVGSLRHFGEMPGSLGFPETRVQTPGVLGHLPSSIAASCEDALEMLSASTLVALDQDALYLYLSSISAASVKCNSIVGCCEMLVLQRSHDVGA